MATKYTSRIETKKAYWSFAPSVLIAIGIAIASLWEDPQMPEAMEVSDALLHGIMYIFFAASLTIPILYLYPARAITYIYTCAVSTAYGALMELLQYLCTETRTASMEDMYGNLGGSMLGVALSAVCRKMFLDEGSKE